MWAKGKISCKAVSRTFSRRSASYTADHLKSFKTFKGDGCVTSRPRVRRPRIVGRKVQPENVRAYTLAHPQSSAKMISENYGLSKNRNGQS
ncbi:hypothetical protein AVEN_231953-1 [Araneus ventricosus]|uniref:DUF4817 domain-containing protein n=1 Tax=Araneus ventricosus TaxID=182803 RepID=A0A4Y2BZX4_ARAVE|nr:hypothetical protein AVEN_231953-1 [Araneus ventricosus]